MSNNIAEILKRQAAAAAASHVEIKRAPNPATVSIKQAIAMQNAIARGEYSAPRVSANDEDRILNEKYEAYQRKLNALLAAESEAVFNPVTSDEVTMETAGKDSPVNGISVGEENGISLILKKAKRKRKSAAVVAKAIEEEKASEEMAQAAEESTQVAEETTPADSVMDETTGENVILN